MIYHKILSLSPINNPLTLIQSFVQDFFAHPLPNGTYDWSNYLSGFQQFLPAVKLEHLPEKARKLISENRPGFSAVTLVEVPVHIPGSRERFFFKVNIYIANSENGKIVMVPPHRHVTHSDRLLVDLPQAITYPVYAQSGAKPGEQIYETFGDRAIFKEDIDRRYRPFNHSKTHSLSVSGGSGAFLACYLLKQKDAGQGPDSQYYSEFIQTQDRLEAVARLIEGGLIPFNGAKSELIDYPFVVHPSLHTDKNADLIRIINSVSVKELQKKALKDQFVMTAATTWDDVEGWLKDRGILNSFNEKSIKASILPLITALEDGELEKVILSPKKQTINCYESVLHRVQPTGDKIGTSLENEIKTLVTQDKDGQIHVFISPASYDVAPAAIREHTLFDLATAGCVSLATNPFNLVAGLAEKGLKASVHVHPTLKAVSFVTNNGGDNRVSVTAVSATPISKNGYIQLAIDTFQRHGFTVIPDHTLFQFTSSDPLLSRAQKRERVKKAKIQSSTHSGKLEQRRLLQVRLKSWLFKQDTGKVQEIFTLLQPVAGHFDRVKSAAHVVAFPTYDVSSLSERLHSVLSQRLAVLDAWEDRGKTKPTYGPNLISAQENLVLLDTNLKQLLPLLPEEFQKIDIRVLVQVIGALKFEFASFLNHSHAGDSRLTKDQRAYNLLSSLRSVQVEFLRGHLVLP